MDIRSLRILLGWSKEDLARRSGVPFASVCLLERMGTAGPEGDALMTRVLLASHRSRFPKLLLGCDIVPLEPANDDCGIVLECDPQSESSREGSQPSTAGCGDTGKSHLPSAADPGMQATPSLGGEPDHVGGLICR